MFFSTTASRTKRINGSKTTRCDDGIYILNDHICIIYISIYSIILLDLILTVSRSWRWNNNPLQVQARWRCSSSLHGGDGLPPPFRVGKPGCRRGSWPGTGITGRNILAQEPYSGSNSRWPPHRRHRSISQCRR